MKFPQHLRALALLSASMVASTAFAASSLSPVVSQEVWAGPEPVVAGAALSRAEVQADWLLWKQAGLDAYQRGDRSVGDDSSYAAKLAHYQQQRSSSAFTDLVQRLKSAGL